MRINEGNTTSEFGITYTVLRDDRYLGIYKSCVLRDDSDIRTTRYLRTGWTYTFEQLEKHFNKTTHMNQTLARFARQSIKTGLRNLPSECVRQFNRMYSPNDLGADIDSVVDSMPDDKLDWALTQVENSIIKLNTK